MAYKKTAPKSNSKKPNIAKYSWGSLGMNMAVGMFVLVFIGFKFDEKQRSGHAGIITGIIIGLLYCSYEFWKAAKQLTNE